MNIPATGVQDLSWQESKIYLGRSPRFILAGLLPTAINLSNKTPTKSITNKARQRAITQIENIQSTLWPSNILAMQHISHGRRSPRFILAGLLPTAINLSNKTPTKSITNKARQRAITQIENLQSILWPSNILTAKESSINLGNARPPKSKTYLGRTHGRRSPRFLLAGVQDLS